MRSRPGGNLTAVLMFAVLLSVPLLAIFGFPEFVPASNSLFEQGEAIEEIHFRSSPSPGIGESASFSLSERPDIYAPVQIASSETPPRDQSQAVSHHEQIQNPFLLFEETDQIFAEQTASLNRVTPTDAMAGWEFSNTQTASQNGSSAVTTETFPEPFSSTGSDDPFPGYSSLEINMKPGEFRHSETSRTGSLKSPLTWRLAVRRLNALGIRQFRLEPGSREHEFHFSCSLTPRNNPRVTLRFEAEAGDPLQAVGHVLQQIALWQQKR